MGKTNHGITAPRFRPAGGKVPQKRPFIGRNPAAGETLPARTAPQPYAPRRGGSRLAAPSRPAAPFRARRRKSRMHPAACPKLLLITTIITTAVTATVIIAIIVIAVTARIRGSEGQVTKRGRRTGEPAPCCRAGRCAGAENRRPARGEPSAYRFAALPACGGARKDRCNPFCARVAIRVPEEIASAGATSSGRGAGGWRRRGGRRGAPRIPPRPRERRRRGAGEVSARRRRYRPRVSGSGTQT